MITSCSGNKSAKVEISHNDSISIIQTEKIPTKTTKTIEEKKIVPIKSKVSKSNPIIYNNDSKDDEKPEPRIRVYHEISFDPPIVKNKIISVKKSIIKEDTIDAKIKIGTLVYHIPDTMIAKKTYIIKVRINRDTLDTKIFETFDDKIIQSHIKTTSTMEVAIIDPSPDNDKSFNIVKSNDDDQLVDNDEYTEWVYGITPLKNGKLKLNIVVSIIKDGNKKQIVYFDDIFVKSNPKANISDFVKENWKWGMSTIIIPFIIWWWNNRKKKRRIRKK